MRALCVSTITTVLLVGSAAAVGGQSEETHTTSAVWVTATEIDSGCSAEGGTSSSEAGVERHRDLIVTCADTWSDPRVSGTKSVIYNDDCYGTAPCLYWGTQETVGPDGTWTGWFNGTLDPERGATGYVVMTGIGAYEGLTFVSYAMGPFGEPGIAYGLIYEGPPPPTGPQSAVSEK